MLLGSAIVVSEVIAVAIVVGDRNLAETFAFDSRTISQAVTAFGLASDVGADPAGAIQRVSTREQMFLTVAELPELSLPWLALDEQLSARLAAGLAADGHANVETRAGSFTGPPPLMLFGPIRRPSPANFPPTSTTFPERGPNPAFAPFSEFGDGLDKLPKFTPDRTGWHSDMPRERSYFLAARLPGGNWLISIARRPPSVWPLVQRASLAALAIAIVTLGITAVIAALIVRPINRLTAALATLGRGRQPPELMPEGPQDVRAAIMAFNATSSSITRTMASQQRMLAAVGHDLATPLTALRLRAESVEEIDTRQRMITLIEEMQTLTQDVLTLAREAAPREENRPVDLGSLIDSLCQDLQDLNFDVSFNSAPPVIWYGRSNSLRRALRNLIENGCQYGVRAQVTLRKLNGFASIAIEDRGPGIPEHRLADVMNPFVRLERSRNRRTGGSGLGLPISQTIIESLGGDLTLSNRTSGGLRAEVRLPLIGDAPVAANH